MTRLKYSLKYSDSCEAELVTSFHLRDESLAKAEVEARRQRLY